MDLLKNFDKVGLSCPAKSAEDEINKLLQVKDASNVGSLFSQCPHSEAEQGERLRAPHISRTIWASTAWIR